MNDQPILSVAIPTHNRAAYAIHCIKSLLAIDGNLEVVISDSSSDLKLQKQLETFHRSLLDDSRLKYLPTSHKLSMAENLNRCIENCTGYYVSFIGDDDTLSPKILDYLTRFRKYNCDAISPDIVVNYAWPDFETMFFKHGHKQNLYFRIEAPSVKLINSSEALMSAVNSCFQGTEGLAKLYHGFVARTVLSQIRDRHGVFVGGSTPDVYGAVAVTANIERYIRCNIPMSIPGASGMSNTGRASRSAHVGKLNSERQTAHLARDDWPEWLPEYFSVETVWAQSGLQAAARSGFNRLEEFPKEKFLALCIIRHPIFIKSNIASINFCRKNNPEWSTAALLKYLILYTYSFIRRVFLRCLNPTASNGRPHLKNIENIEHAFNVLNNKYLNEANFDHERCLAAIDNFFTRRDL